MSCLILLKETTGLELYALCEGVVNGRAGVNVGPVRSISCEILQKRFKLRIASVNVGSMRGRASEIVDTLARRISCLSCSISCFLETLS